MTDQRGGQAFYIVRTPQRINHSSYPSLLLQDELGIACNMGRKIRRERQGLIEAIGV